ncbi:hypothetical protein [Aestuariimicrobium kwangyangense]|uniref:hypothetical protein n=1 Tax=Aestuariimicrobium kwangyangense TaxID=396389 RepID=UPI0003B3D93A|nr:hypothetical protein [Aestuariimicrobium kwangyangense]
MAKKRKEFFELPFTVDAPRLVNPALGVDRLTMSPKQSFELGTTLLDAADHRLLRAGVMLAHRVQAGLGEWYLDAPGWQPWLPVDHVVELGAAGDLPADLAELVRPFRRLATLGPVAAINQERHVFTIKDSDDVTLGSLRDEKITIRRGGLTTARFREATLECGPAMTTGQRRFLAEGLLSVGGVRVDEFPDAMHRLGAPGTGLSDFPEPREYDSSTSLEVFVSSLFAERLRSVMRADLALRASDLARQARATSDPDLAPGQMLSAEPVFSELETLAVQLRALAGVLEPAWREKLENELVSLVHGERDLPISRLDDRYYGVLDALVQAVRAPQLGDWSQRKAREVLQQQAQSGLSILATRITRLTPEAPLDQWQAVQAAATQLLVGVEGVGGLFGKRGKQLRKRLKQLLAALEPCVVPVEEPDADELAALDGPTAYRRGLEAADATRARRQARTEFIQAWPKLRSRISEGGL